MVDAEAQGAGRLPYGLWPCFALLLGAASSAGQPRTFCSYLLSHHSLLRRGHPAHLPHTANSRHCRPQAEEAVLYPFIEKRMGQEGTEFSQHSLKEHKKLDRELCEALNKRKVGRAPLGSAGWGHGGLGSARHSALGMYVLRLEEQVKSSCKRLPRVGAKWGASACLGGRGMAGAVLSPALAAAEGVQVMPAAGPRCLVGLRPRSQVWVPLQYPLHFISTLNAEAARLLAACAGGRGAV